MNFILEYRKLETRIFNELRTLIYKSEYVSKHIDAKAIQVNLFNYTELTVINDRLTFLDCNGYHYSVLSDADLEDLIDIINTN